MFEACRCRNRLPSPRGKQKEAIALQTVQYGTDVASAETPVLFGVNRRRTLFVFVLLDNTTLNYLFFCANFFCANIFCANFFCAACGKNYSRPIYSRFCILWRNGYAMEKRLFVTVQNSDLDNNAGMRRLAALVLGTWRLLLCNDCLQ